MKFIHRLAILILALSICTLGFSQVPKLDQDHLKNLKFRNLGPAGMSGRVTAIDVDMSNTDRIFVGAASGGVWLSENAGVSWKPVFDEQNSLAIGSIKINQKNPAEIWVGTGEGNPRNSLNTGNGIYKSIDGGKTWTNMGLKNTKTIHRIVINEHNANIVYAASLGSPWGANEERGVFRTKDGGKTWDKVLYVNDLTGAADMVVDPTNPNKIVVAMWEHLRRPWTMTSGGKGSGLYITYDGGDNWKRVSSDDGMPKGDLGRIGVAISASNPNTIYALVEAKENGYFKSTDGGIKWKSVPSNDVGGRPFYYSEIYVDPTNENRIYNLHTYVIMSEDGARTFSSIADYGNDVHPDHHAFWINPKDPSHLINGNDGGLNISYDMGKTWRFVDNLPVGQFYHVNVDKDFPYNVYGGMQDNGSWVGPSAVLKNGGIRNDDFRELFFGDGFDVVPNVENSRYGYAMSQGGSVGYYDRETGATRFVQPTHADTTELRFNWNAAIAQDPFRNDGAYFGSQFVHYTEDRGESWKTISPDLTTNDKARQKSGESGGLTIDATGAENFCTILAIAPSPVDKNVIWVGTDDGNLQLTQDGGKTWTNIIDRIKSAPKGAWIPYIEVSKTKANEAYIIINNYRNNDYSAYAYFTSDYGKSWTRIVDDSQVEGFTLCIVQHPKTPNLMFLGTDAGLYVSFDKATSWQLLSKNFPQVQVADLKIQEQENDLVIGTFGRSLWILDNLAMLEDIAKDKNLFAKKLAISTPSNGYNVSYRSVDGIRFKAQAEFTGDNDNIGTVSIPVWKMPAPKKVEGDKAVTVDKAKKVDDKPKSDDKAKVIVLNQAGDTIRNFATKLEEGYSTVNWRMEENGFNFPSKRKREKDADPPSGTKVLPGTYKIVIVDGDARDSTTATVKHDPRLSVSMADLQKSHNTYVTFSKKVEKAAEAYQLLVDAKEAIKLTETLLTNQEDTVKKEFKTIHKNLNEKIDSLDLLFFQKEAKKGIVRDSKNLMGTIYDAMGYMRGRVGALGGNGEIAMTKAELDINKTVSAVNAFIGSDWIKYVEKVNNLKPVKIKEILPVKMN